MTMNAQIHSQTWLVTPDLLGVLNDGGIFEHVNPAWEATLGWTEEEIKASKFQDFLHPDDLEQTNLAFASIKKGTPVLRLQNRYRTKSGAYRWLSWVAVPEEDKYFCSARDITEEKEIAQSALRHKEDSQLREQFIAVLGHDLRNPLASISSGLRLISQSGGHEQSEEIMRMMEGSVTRIDRLIRDLMDFAEGRLGKGLTLKRDPETPLLPVLELVVDELRATTPNKEIATTFNLTEKVSCDKMRIGQMLSNLLSNALTHGIDDRPVQVSAHTLDGRLCIEVANSGKPIDDATIKRLFQPFVRGRAHGDRKGLGLGLYIASEIAHAHGGSLTVTSNDAETRFVFDVPMT